MIQYYISIGIISIVSILVLTNNISLRKSLRVKTNLLEDANKDMEFFKRQSEEYKGMAKDCLILEFIRDESVKLPALVEEYEYWKKFNVYRQDGEIKVLIKSAYGIILSTLRIATINAYTQKKLPRY